MSASEELREALVNLERARQREALQRSISDGLLDGLRVLVMTRNPQDVFRELFDVLRSHLDYEAAFVLTVSSAGKLTPTAASDDVFARTVWNQGPLFARVIRGHPVALFDTVKVEEWRDQPESILSRFRSALHFSMHTAEQKAIFVAAHSRRGHFGRHHLELARRFSFLATQALQQLEADARLGVLEEKLRAEARLRELEQRLAESEERLTRARKMEAVGLLAGGVAHDLNNILSGIVSLPELLLMEPDLSPDAREMLTEIAESGARAAAVVSDLLTIARGVARVRAPLEINQIVRDHLASPECRTLAQRYPNITLSSSLIDEPTTVLGSEVHLRKLLMNLITNAFEAQSDEGRGQVVVRTRLDHGESAEPNGRSASVIVEVDDDGPGIPAEDMARIFEPFFSRKSWGRSGTGLGLAIVWNTVQEHDGHIEVERLTKGTRFRLRLPLASCSQDAQDGMPSRTVPGNGERILVVDDLESQRRIACRMLQALGYQAEAVASGEEAVELLRHRQADLLLLDMLLQPGIDGCETYRMVLARNPKQRAIIVSGFSKSELVEEALRLGACSLLQKPYTLDQLAEAVRKGLAG